MVIQKNQNGRSMVEMLGVLAIIGVLSIGGIAGYSLAMKKYKVNKTEEAFYTLVYTLIQYNSQYSKKELTEDKSHYSTSTERIEMFNFDENSIAATILKSANLGNPPFAIDVALSFGTDAILAMTYTIGDPIGIAACERIAAINWSEIDPRLSSIYEPRNCENGSQYTIIMRLS